MLLLALDTATERGSLALTGRGRLLGEVLMPSAGTYLQQLLPGVEALLKAAGCRLEELGAIAVSVGPGNFTGLRIGLATAKGLAWALGCPLVPVPTPEALAAQFPFQPQPVGVLLDAKRGEVFWGLFHCPVEVPELQGEVRRLPVSDLAPTLQPPLLLTGPGLEVHGSFLQQTLPREISWAPPEMRYPRAATLARLARRRLAGGLTATPAQLVPSYLRPAL